MSNAQHTPGPWTWVGGAQPLTGPDGLIVNGTGRSSAERAANRAPIAAAPALYEALAKIEHKAIALAEEADSEGHSWEADDARDIIAYARAALAQVEGEAS